MDNEKKSSASVTTPAYLWVGNHDLLVEHAITFLQKQFCQNNGCMICMVCRQIGQQQYHNVIWLHPEKQYALDDLDVIFKTLSFALEEDQQFYFVIQKADYLTPVCANSLLKSLEEPPRGYHFLLLATRPEAVLPTIQSRCVITSYSSLLHAGPHSLLAYFTAYRMSDPITFMQDLDKMVPTERESVELIDQLLAHWITEFKKSVIDADTKKNQHALRVIEHLKQLLQKPPMPGSSKLFWKNLFIQCSSL